MANKEAKKSSAEKPELKRSWFQELAAEFKKITWPSRETLVKESVTVILSAIVIGAIVAVLDLGMRYGFEHLVELVQNIG